MIFDSDKFKIFMMYISSYNITMLLLIDGDPYSSHPWLAFQIPNIYEPYIVSINHYFLHI